MIRQYAYVARMLLDRRVRDVPVRVLGELSRRGKRRLPEGVQQSLLGRFPHLDGLRYVHRWLDGEMITRHQGQWVINSFLPPFPGRAYDRMFENLLSGRRLSPVSAFLAITGECPYRCWHCSFKQRGEGKLSAEVWRRIIGQLHQLGASIIGFTGGEPCTREDLPELVQAASAGEAATIVFTSGACVDDALVARLREAGLWSLCVSLDHPEPAEHDRLRSAPGSHARALRVLHRARKEGLYAMVGTVATQTLVRDNLLGRMHRLAGDHGAHELRIVEPMPCGLLANGKDEIFLNDSQIGVLRKFHVETNRRGIPPKVCAFNQIESPELFGCGAGTQHLFIDARGEVCPCDFTAMSFGNAAEVSLDQIWTRMSTAMGNPRQHCFIRKHHDLLLRHAQGKFPLDPETSLRVCTEAGGEPLPEFFQQMMGQR